MTPQKPAPSGTDTIPRLPSSNIEWFGLSGYRATRGPWPLAMPALSGWREGISMSFCVAVHGCGDRVKTGCGAIGGSLPLIGERRRGGNVQHPARSDTWFDGLVHDVEPRLRHALVAVYGQEQGRDATVEALAYAWEHREEIKSMANPAGYL